MGNVITGLIVLAIIVAFITPWLRRTIQRFRSPQAGRRPSRSPRDLSESGGYQPISPVPKKRVNRPTMAGDSGEDAPMILRRSSDMPVDSDSGSVRTLDNRSVRRILATPESLRTAIIIKEIIDRPVSMKQH